MEKLLIHSDVLINNTKNNLQKVESHFLKVVLFIDYAFFIITLRHLGHDTLILPTPLGTLMLALQFLQRKYLWVFLFFHASRFIESHEVNFRFIARNFIFSLYLSYQSNFKPVQLLLQLLSIPLQN